MPYFAIHPDDIQKAFEAGHEQGMNLALNPDARLQAWFPGLKPGRYRIIGNATATYNCIAWAVGKRDAHWWPGQVPQSYWPPSIPPYATLDAFVQMFGLFGYEKCTNPAFERRFEKIAIFVSNQQVTHAARQRGNGRWSSKAGPWELFEHDLQAPEAAYGSIEQFMRRKRSLAQMIWEAVYFLSEPRVS